MNGSGTTVDYCCGPIQSNNKCVALDDDGWRRDCAKRAGGTENEVTTSSERVEFLRKNDSRNMTHSLVTGLLFDFFESNSQAGACEPPPSSPAGE